MPGSLSTEAPLRPRRYLLQETGSISGLDTGVCLLGLLLRRPPGATSPVARALGTAAPLIQKDHTAPHAKSGREGAH